MSFSYLGAALNPNATPGDHGIETQGKIDVRSSVYHRNSKGRASTAFDGDAVVASIWVRVDASSPARHRRSSAGVSRTRSEDRVTRLLESLRRYDAPLAELNLHAFDAPPHLLHAAVERQVSSLLRDAVVADVVEEAGRADLGVVDREALVVGLEGLRVF